MECRGSSEDGTAIDSSVELGDGRELPCALFLEGDVSVILYGIKSHIKVCWAVH